MNKKFIAIITALALVVTLLAPVGVQEASAATKNKVDRVVTVDSDTNLGDLNNTPKLIIEVDDKKVTDATYAWEDEETFRLELPSTAEWNSSVKVTNGTATILTDQILEVTTDAGLDDGDTVEVELDVKIKSSASGEQKVTIIPRNSRVTGGSYTFAIVQSGKTVATVGSKKTVSRGVATGAAIIIDETAVGTITGDNNKFRLRLPNHVEWAKGTTIEFTGFTVKDVEFDGKDDAVNEITPGQEYELRPGNGKRTLDIKFNVDADSDKTLGSIIITPVIDVKRDAKFGEITVDITNTSSNITSQSGLVIAEYKDYGIEVEVEEVKEMLAGRLDIGNDEFLTAKIKIKETAENSIARGRVIDFELPSWVKIATADEIEIEFKKAGDKFDRDTDLYVDSKGSEFEINTRNLDDDKAEFEIKLPLTIKGTETGDINLKISGAGIEEQEVTIAKAIAPVTAEVNVSDVRIGVQNQKAPDIIIKENKAGALKEGKLLILKFVEAQGFKFDRATFEVIEGDLEIDLDKSGRTGDNNEGLKIYIDTESSEPSTIKVSGIEMTVDRTAPEGPVKLDITGEAVVNNKTSDFDDFVNRVARFDFANVITPAPGETRATVVFTIDSTTYTVTEAGKEVERTMDVAPYIKDSRTFLPVFFVAQALGVSENNVVWEPHSKTVTIFKGDRVAQMQIGSNVLLINGTPVQMDTAPEIKDGRTMLPVFFVGQALGASVEWDADARTVTVTQ